MSNTWWKTVTKNFQLTENPSEPVQQLHTYYEYKTIHLHSISSFSEDLNNEFLILLLPSPHVRFRVGVDNRPNIIHDILFLSALIVEGHFERGQRLEDISYVEFWSTSDTYTKGWNLKVDQLLHKSKNTVARGWNPRDVGTLVKGVHYQVDRALI